MLLSLKKGKYLILVLFLMSTLTFSQDWNQTIQLNIPCTDVDLCTNMNGNNILAYDANGPSLKYYLVSTTGQIIRITNSFETQQVEFPCIDGNSDRVYIVYKLGNFLKTWKSTDAGVSWSSIANINIGNNVCNNIDITFGNDNALHIVWATRDNYPYFKTYYRKLPANGIWTTTENVTNGSYVGGFPTVSTSTDRVHVSYNSGMEPYPLSNLGDAKSRDKYYTNWQTPQTVFSDDSKLERIHSGSSKLFDFYYQDMLNWSCNLYAKERAYNETNWSTPVLFNYGSDPTQIISAANTNDGKTHVVYVMSGGIGGRSYDGTWSDPFLILNNVYYSSRISAVSNDLFVVARYGNVYYRQYDDIPLAPNNLQVTRSLNNHPYLTWSANPEPDFDHYIVEKAYQGGWTTLTQTTNTYFEDPNETYCTAPPPQVCDGERTVTYHVSAVDKHPYTSLPSEVKTNVTGGYPPDKAVAQISEMPGKYELQQNYPNPFNPSTSITYSLKNPEFVTLKIFDMLGREVAELVNENKPEGKYTVEFNSGDLPSGIYIYKLDAGKFSDMKKMLLIK